MKTQFIVAVPSETDILTVDGISYEGKLWLVPQWIESKSEQISKPLRMVRFDNLPHIENPPSGHDYAVNQQVPKAVLDGQASSGFQTLSGNEITFGIRRVSKPY